MNISDILKKLHDGSATLDEIFAELLAGVSRRRALDILTEVLDSATNLDEGLLAIVDFAYSKILKDELYTERFDSVSHFEDAIQYRDNIEPMIAKYRDIQQRKDKKKREIESNWGLPLCQIFSADTKPPIFSRNFLYALCQLSILVARSVGMELLDNARIQRLSKKQRSGNNAIRYFIVSDIEAAKSHAKQLSRTDPTTASLPAGVILQPRTSDAARGRSSDSYDADGDTDDGEVEEDADGDTDDNSVEEGEPSSKLVDPNRPARLGVSRSRVSVIIPRHEANGSSDGEELHVPNGPPRKRARAKHALPTSNCACTEACKDVVNTLPQDRKFMGIDLGLRALKTAYRVTNKTFEGFCFAHLRLLMSTATGMRNSYDGADFDSMKLRLTTYLKYRNDIPRLRRKKYDWFCAELQNNTIRSQLGGMKYAPQAIPTVDIDPRAVFGRFATHEAWDNFCKNGSVNVSGIFSYLLDNDQYSQWINLEFAMYEHHFHSKGNNGKGLGWLRNMWYSLIQQIVRQDPVYYALVVAARPDTNWRLISYPYYTKYTLDGENTGFSHLDLNIRHFVESGKGANIVQGGLSLTDETDKNCTTLVLGFHSRAREWYADLLARGEGDVAGETTDCKSLYSPADRRKYGDLLPIPCRRGDVRITLPEIIHGTTPRADGTRQTVLPWFTGICKGDHEYLDNKESESWSQVAACHRDMIPCKKSPSGRAATAYQNGPSFQAAVRLGSTSCIGDALVGRQRWDSPQVLVQVRVLFGSDDAAAKRLVSKIRKKIIEEYQVAWEELKNLEREIYGDKSFFWLQENGKAAPIADGSEESDLSSAEGEVILTSDPEDL